MSVIMHTSKFSDGDCSGKRVAFGASVASGNPCSSDVSGEQDGLVDSDGRKLDECSN